MNDLAFLRVTDGGEGRYVVVDAHRFPDLNLSTWHWWVNDEGRVNIIANSGRYKGRTLTKVVNGTPDGFDTDHINEDPRDYTERNLRTATRSQNMANRGKPDTGHNTSEIKGIFSAGIKWTAQVCVNYKRIHLGTYETEIEAGYAYNYAARACFGSFAKLNRLKPLPELDLMIIRDKVRSIIREKVFNGGKLPDELSPHLSVEGTLVKPQSQQERT